MFTDLLVTLPTVFFVFKETKGVSLEEIDLLFGEDVSGVLPEDIEKHHGIQIEHTSNRHDIAV